MFNELNVSGFSRFLDNGDWNRKNKVSLDNNSSMNSKNQKSK